MSARRVVAVSPAPAASVGRGWIVGGLIAGGTVTAGLISLLLFRAVVSTSSVPTLTGSPSPQVIYRPTVVVPQVPTMTYPVVVSPHYPPNQTYQPGYTPAYPPNMGYRSPQGLVETRPGGGHSAGGRVATH